MVFERMENRSSQTKIEAKVKVKIISKTKR
jgi:hypothetical protein